MRNGGIALIGALVLASPELHAEDALEVRLAVIPADGAAATQPGKLTDGLYGELDGKVPLVAKDELDAALKKAKAKTLEAQLDVAKELGADYVLRTETSKKGWLYSAQARLYAVGGGDPQMDFTVGYYKPPEEAKDRGGRIALKLIEKLGILKADGRLVKASGAAVPSGSTASSSGSTGSSGSTASSAGSTGSSGSTGSTGSSGSSGSSGSTASSSGSTGSSGSTASSSGSSGSTAASSGSSGSTASSSGSSGSTSGSSASTGSSGSSGSTGSTASSSGSTSSGSRSSGEPHGPTTAQVGAEEPPEEPARELLRMSLTLGTGILHDHAISGSQVDRSGLSYQMSPIGLIAADFEVLLPRVGVGVYAHGQLSPIRAHTNIAGIERDPRGIIFDFGAALRIHYPLIGEGGAGSLYLIPEVGLSFLFTSIDNSQVTASVLVSSNAIVPSAGIWARYLVSRALEIEGGADGGFVAQHKQSPLGDGDPQGGFQITGGISSRFWLTRLFGLALETRVSYVAYSMQGALTRQIPANEVLRDVTVTDTDVRASLGAALRL